MKKKITRLNFQLETDSIERHRYRSIDDWYNPIITGTYANFLVQTADTGNMDYNFLILLHALIEQYLCYKHGITDEQVSKFDMEHTHCTDPGFHDEAPYHEEHANAEHIEQLMADFLGVDWDSYDEKIDKTLKKWKKRGDKK